MIQERKVQVLIVAHPGDQHADHVERGLALQGISTLRTSLNTLRSTPLSWSPNGPLKFLSDDVEREIDSTTTVWWRRPGKTSIEDLAQDEARLAAAECLFILRGTLASARPRWVDLPAHVELAENKIYQLSIAHRLGLRTPTSLLTNFPQFAKDFAASSEIIAKSVSVGPGIAPFVQVVPIDLLETVSAMPVLLQELIVAEADLRTVTIGNHVFTWRRKRASNEPVDWRAADPGGQDFEPFRPSPEMQKSALEMAHALGLSTTVQDWLLTDSGIVFLEVNPQGQWLFLQSASTIVLPAFARHLMEKK